MKKTTYMNQYNRRRFHIY